MQQAFDDRDSRNLEGPSLSITAVNVDPAVNAKVWGVELWEPGGWPMEWGASDGW